MDQQIVACVPCLEGIQTGYKIYQGSIIKECSQCHAKVWVGPECMKKHEKSGIELWCMKCIIKTHGPDALNSMKPLTDK